jgi:hypothetical protein
VESFPRRHGSNLVVPAAAMMSRDDSPGSKRETKWSGSIAEMVVLFIFMFTDEDGVIEATNSSSSNESVPSKGARWRGSRQSLIRRESEEGKRKFSWRGIIVVNYYSFATNDFGFSISSSLVDVASGR